MPCRQKRKKNRVAKMPHFVKVVAFLCYSTTINPFILRAVLPFNIFMRGGNKRSHSLTLSGSRKMQFFFKFVWRHQWVKKINVYGYLRPYEKLLKIKQKG